MNRRRLGTFFLLATLALGGCRPEPQRRPDPSLLPPVYHGAAAIPAAGKPLASEWWHDFQDPHLNELLTVLFAQSPDIEQLLARHQQAAAVLRQQEAQQQPTLTASGQMSREEQPGLFEDVIGNNYRFSLTAAYEVDIWQKMANRAQAASLNEAASLEELQAIYLSLSCQAADLYYLVVVQQQQLQLSAATIKSFQDTFERVRRRYFQGLVPAVDFYQSRQNLAAARATHSRDQANLQTARNALAALLGLYRLPPKQKIAAELPRQPPLADPGIPATLLQQRPDVRAAWLRVQAADAQVAAAIADCYPRLNLSGDWGRSRTTFGLDPITGTFWRLLAGVVEPIIDGGSRRAEVQRRRAIVQERLAAYRRTLVDAVREVEDALAHNQHTATRIVYLEQEENDAREALRLARDRYLAGITDYLPVLTAQQQHFIIQRNLLDARHQLVADRLSLIRALGGSWPIVKIAARQEQAKSRGKE